MKKGSDDADSCTAVCDQIHDNSAVELHRENFHGDTSELFSLTIHVVSSCLVNLIYLKSSHAGEAFKEMVSEPVIYFKIVPEYLFSYRHD